MSFVLVRGGDENVLTVPATHVRSHPQAAAVQFPHATGDNFGEAKNFWCKDK
jgi:hypothetical protein